MMKQTTKSRTKDPRGGLTQAGRDKLLVCDRALPDHAQLDQRDYKRPCRADSGGLFPAQWRTQIFTDIFVSVILGGRRQTGFVREPLGLRFVAGSIARRSSAVDCFGARQARLSASAASSLRRCEWSHAFRALRQVGRAEFFWFVCSSKHLSRLICSAGSAVNLPGGIARVRRCQLDIDGRELGRLTRAAHWCRASELL